jgi:hypothetical protein
MGRAFLLVVAACCAAAGCLEDARTTVNPLTAGPGGNAGTGGAGGSGGGAAPRPHGQPPDDLAGTTGETALAGVWQGRCT